jgi:RHS repeat-associated protein
MAGISSQAAGKLVNKDKTFQGQKFDDDLGIDYYSFKWRNHDPQIGRFIEIDPLADEYEYNSTYAFSENKVTGHVELEGLEAVSAELIRDAQAAPPQVKPFILIGAGLALLGEFLYDHPEALSGGGKSQSYPATFDLYIKSGETKPSATVNSTPTDQTNSRAGKPFTPKEKEKVIEANKEKNNGTTVCENCKTNTTKPDQSKKGVTPPKTDTQVDHVKPKSKGGSGTADNGQVLCRDCNGKKSDKVVVPEKKN